MFEILWWIQPEDVCAFRLSENHLELTYFDGLLRPLPPGVLQFVNSACLTVLFIFAKPVRSVVINHVIDNAAVSFRAVSRG